jgi:hypothetical protein
MTLARGTKKLVVQEALLMILKELSYSSCFVYHCIIFIYSFFLMTVLGFGLRASHLLGRHSYCLSHSASPLLMLGAHHKHEYINKKGRENGPFGSTLQVSPILRYGSEDPCQLYNIFNTSITIFDVEKILLLEAGNSLPIDTKLPVLSLDCAVELEMGESY